MELWNLIKIWNFYIYIKLYNLMEDNFMLKKINCYSNKRKSKLQTNYPVFCIIYLQRCSQSREEENKIKEKE